MGREQLLVLKIPVIPLARPAQLKRHNLYVRTTEYGKSEYTTQYPALSLEAYDKGKPRETGGRKVKGLHGRRVSNIESSLLLLRRLNLGHTTVAGLPGCRNVEHGKTPTKAKPE